MLSFGRRIGAAAALVGAVACGGERGKGARGSDAEGAAPTDPRRCALPDLDDLPADTAAVRCAEWFVARNGYTDAAPVQDTAQLASEPLERAPSTAVLLARRRNSLARDAAIVCAGARRGRERTSGFTVAFLPPGDSTGAFARSVTMDSTFAEMRVEHETLLPQAALRDTVACHPLAGMPQGRRGRGAT